MGYSENLPKRPSPYWVRSKQLGVLKAVAQTFRQPQPDKWQVVHYQAVARSPSIGQFNNLWQKNVRTYPRARHVVFIAGHGNQAGSAGLKYSQLGRSIRGAEAIFLDTCNGSQLESLVKLADSAQVAVASTHTVRGQGFPLEEMFGRTSFPERARDLGAALVQAAHHNMPSESLVAVDLPVLRDQLLPALDRLGQRLSRASQVGRGDSVERALKSSVAPQKGRRIDLGSFLARLHDDPSFKNLPEVLGARRAFNETILSKAGKGTLSFDLNPGKEMPVGWSGFLQARG